MPGHIFYSEKRRLFDTISPPKAPCVKRKILYDLLNHQANSVGVISNYNMRMSLHKTSTFKNPCEVTSRSRIFLFSLVNVSVGLWVVRDLLAKRKTIQTWNLAHILPLILSKNGFFVFSIKSPWRPLASKNCRVTWILRISPRFPSNSLFPDFLN